jgi:anti-sigma B factor antagonist
MAPGPRNASRHGEAYGVGGRAFSTRPIPEVIMKIEQQGEVTVVSFTSDHLDASNNPEFKLTMAPVIEKSDKVLLDMGEVRFVDSSGLGSILSCLRSLHERNGDLKICSVSKPVRVLFELVRLQKIIDIVEGRQEAIEAFGSSERA